MIDFLSLGTINGSSQQMLAPSDTAIRVFNIHFALTGTGTPAAACMVLANAVGTVATTASPSAVYATAYYDADIPVGAGNMSFHDGLLFPDGVFIQTASALDYYTITYRAEGPK